MNWADDARAEARGLLRAHAKDLYDEAERVADRADAPGVSVEYVRQAAATVRLRRTSGLADALLAIGPALTTLPGGIGVAQVTSQTALKLESWVVVAAITCAALGLLLTGAGIALKLVRR